MRGRRKKEKGKRREKRRPEKKKSSIIKLCAGLPTKENVARLCMQREEVKVLAKEAVRD